MTTSASPWGSRVLTTGPASRSYRLAALTDQANATSIRQHRARVASLTPRLAERMAAMLREWWMVDPHCRVTRVNRTVSAWRNGNDNMNGNTSFHSGLGPWLRLTCARAS